MKTAFKRAGVVLVALAIALPLVAAAQTQATMPVLYNQNGQAVNNGNTTALPAGYYYLGTGGTQQVYYYGNGTYYDLTNKVYGGSVRDPNGTAGVSLAYDTSVTPTAPNTGLGGNAGAVWGALALSAMVVMAGAAYIVTYRHEHFA